jgi:hypothetical protein
MDFDMRQAVMARARRARAEAIGALLAAAANALRTQWLKLRHAWVGLRTGTPPHTVKRP